MIKEDKYCSTSSAGIGSLGSIGFDQDDPSRGSSCSREINRSFRINLISSADSVRSTESGSLFDMVTPHESRAAAILVALANLIKMRLWCRLYFDVYQ